MSKYYLHVEQTIQQDDLITDYANVIVENVSLSGGVAVERGMILGGVSGVYSPVTSSSDVEKVLCIAAADETSDATVTSAYFSGRFREDKLKLGAADIEDFREPLRKSNITLTKLKEWA